MRRMLVGLVLVTGLTAACSSTSASTSTTLSIPAAQQAVDHWQNVANQDQELLSSSGAFMPYPCPPESEPSACQGLASEYGFKQVNAKFKADQKGLRVAQDELKKAEG